MKTLFRKTPHRPEDPFHFANQVSEIHDFFYDFNLAKDPTNQQQGPLPGYCYICNRVVLFDVDRPAGEIPVNWRETLKCPTCGMINRWRGCIHLFEALCAPDDRSRVYITEALTPVADYLRSRYPGLVSSEYIESMAPGEILQVHERSIRNEDVTRLSFEDGSFDALLTFDVLEHVPDYRRALTEFYRVLDQGGHLIMTAPFTFSQKGIVRAILDAGGQIHHLVKPCYHGDPMSDEGILAYYDFGMELLEELDEIGFIENAVALWNTHDWGYEGPNIAFVSLKPH